MHATAQTVSPISLRRRVTDHVMTGVAVLTVLLVLAPLVAIFGYLMYRGIGSINWAFLTQTPKPVGEAGGGMANAIVGSIFILGIASLIGVPFGVGAGIYLAEFGRNRFGSAIRFTADVLNGVPSIVIGIVGWSILVRGRGFSALAGGVALAIMMVPTIIPHHGRNAVAGADSDARSGLRFGNSALENNAFHYVTHGNLGCDHGNHAGVCAHRRRNRPTALYRIRKYILELEGDAAHRRFATADLSCTPTRRTTIGIVRHGPDHLY